MAGCPRPCWGYSRSPSPRSPGTWAGLISSWAVAAAAASGHSAAGGGDPRAAGRKCPASCRCYREIKAIMASHSISARKRIVWAVKACGCHCPWKGWDFSNLYRRIGGLPLFFRKSLKFRGGEGLGTGSGLMWRSQCGFPFFICCLDPSAPNNHEATPHHF